MKTRLLDLTDEEDRLLQEYAEANRRSWHAILRDAVRDYLTARGVPMPNYVREPERTMPDEEWSRQFNEALAAIRASVRTDLTPEQIEAEITAASEELRQERIAERERRRKRSA